MVKTKNYVSIFSNIAICFLLGIIAIFCVAPIINTLAVSLSDQAIASTGTVNFIPKKFTLNSYKVLLNDPKFLISFSVSIKRVLLGGIINFLLTILTAYPLSKERKNFRLRNVYMWILVFTMLFNGGLIPWYVTINKLGLIDTIWALVLPGAVPVFNVIILMNFFRGIPKQLEEAAYVDGAGPWYVMARIYVPLSLPALATVTLFSIVGHWNAFFDGLLLMNSPDKYPLQTYIQQLVAALNQLSNMTSEEIKSMTEISNKTLNAAKLIISMVPLLAVYPFLQRYFIHGIVMGSVKE